MLTGSRIKDIIAGKADQKGLFLLNNPSDSSCQKSSPGPTLPAVFNFITSSRLFCFQMSSGSVSTNVTRGN